MDVVQKIANEIILASQILHTNKVSKIAEELGYQPLLIINALYFGDRDGKFTYVKKKDIIKIDPEVVIGTLALTEGISDTREQIELFIEAQNSLEKDVAIDDLRGFLPSVPELHLKIAVETSTELATYEFADPKDKESVYTFITLKDNIDKKFGTRQFDETNTKAARHAKRVK